MKYYTDKQKRIRPLPKTDKKPSNPKKLIEPKMFKPINPNGTWTPAYQETRRNKDLLKTIYEKLNKQQQTKIDEILKQANQNKTIPLSKRRIIALQKALQHAITKNSTQCFFCHKKIKHTARLTTHHINGDHYDDRPKNKAICHERCHRIFHYNDVAPRNPKQT